MSPHRRLLAASAETRSRVPLVSKGPGNPCCATLALSFEAPRAVPPCVYYVPICVADTWAVLCQGAGTSATCLPFHAPWVRQSPSHGRICMSEVTLRAVRCYFGGVFGSMGIRLFCRAVWAPSSSCPASAPRTVSHAQCREAGCGEQWPSPLFTLTSGLGTVAEQQQPLPRPSGSVQPPVAMWLGGQWLSPALCASQRSSLCLPRMGGSELSILSPLQSREKVAHSGCVCKYCDSIFLLCLFFKRGVGIK